MKVCVSECDQRQFSFLEKIGKIASSLPPPQIVVASRVVSSNLTCHVGEVEWRAEVGARAFFFLRYSFSCFLQRPYALLAVALLYEK